MILSSLKQQWKRALLLVVFFSAIVILQTDANWKSSEEGRYYKQQSDYIATHNVMDRVTFFETLIADSNKTVSIIDAIEMFNDYDGKIPEGETDPLLAVTTGAAYMDYDMAIWRQNMLNMPGQYTETVSGDRWMFKYLLDRLYYIHNFDVIIENQKETMVRAIRRGGNAVPLYETALEELSNIEYDFPVIDTAFTALLLDYMSTDWYIVIILCLAFFGVFSTAAQQKITNQILISKTGMRRYAISQILAVHIITVGVLIVYYCCIIFACSSGNPRAIAWQLPIQCVFGEHFDTYYIYYDLKVWQYFLLIGSIKIIFCVMMTSLVLFLSALSRNNIISVLLTITVCGVLCVLSRRWEWGGLLIGNGHILLEKLCYFVVNGQIIHYWTVYTAGIFGLIPITNGLTILLSKPMAKGWVT